VKNIKRFHKLKEASNEMAQFFGYMEMYEWEKCKFYEYDAEAFEEVCHNPKVEREGDFFPQEECWKCPKREEKP